MEMSERELLSGSNFNISHKTWTIQRIIDMFLKIFLCIHVRKKLGKKQPKRIITDQWNMRKRKQKQRVTLLILTHILREGKGDRHTHTNTYKHSSFRNSHTMNTWMYVLVVEYTPKNKPFQFFNMSIVWGKNKHTNFYNIHLIPKEKAPTTMTTTTKSTATAEICSRNSNAAEVGIFFKRMNQQQ